MAAVVAYPYVSVMEHTDAFQLSGEKARNALVPGQVIIGHGTFDDRTQTGASIFLELRGG